MTKYFNFFFNPQNTGSCKQIETVVDPVSYKDFQIYERFEGCNDIVYMGVCVGMYVTLDAAKQAIDDNESIYRKRSKNYLKKEKQR